MSGRATRIRWGGFTLVELLVVIAIIALLVSILLPSLQKARTQANIVKCVSGARQAYLSVQMYCNDFKNFYPNGDGSAGDSLWHVKLVNLHYMNKEQQTNRGGCPDGPDKYYDYYSSDYYTNPNWPDPSPTPGFPVPPNSSYGLNGILQSGAFMTAFRPNYGVFRRNSPFIRRHENDIGLIFCCAVPWSNQTRHLYPEVYATIGYSVGYFPQETLQGRHQKRGIPVAYCDGHTELVPTSALMVSPTVPAIYPWLDTKPLLFWSEYWLWYTNPANSS